MKKKQCILYDNKICDNCGECNMCDLDPKKVCDNCSACLEMDDDYKTIDVDLTLEENDDPEMLSFEELFPDKAFGGDRNWEDEEEDEEYDDDFDDSDGFYDDEDFEYQDDEDDGLGQDFGELFGE